MNRRAHHNIAQGKPCRKDQAHTLTLCIWKVNSWLGLGGWTVVAHVSNYSHHTEPGTRGVQRAQLDAFAKRVLARPVASHHPLTDHRDCERQWGIAPAKAPPFYQRDPLSLKVCSSD